MYCAIVGLTLYILRETLLNQKKHKNYKDLKMIPKVQSEINNFKEDEKENELSSTELKREYIRAKRKYLGKNLKSITKCINPAEGEGYGNSAIFEEDTSSVEEEVKKKFNLTKTNSLELVSHISESGPYQSIKRFRGNSTTLEASVSRTESYENQNYLYKEQFMTTNNRKINTTTIGHKRNNWY
tara:strand:+ start:2216 stop:2767 length:552 start_codon:yes stop_codon:yes gene_type:complete